MAAMVSASNLLIVTPSPMLQLSCGPKRVSVRWSTQSKNFDAPISAVAADDLARARFTSSATARTLAGRRSGRICRGAVVPVPRVPQQQSNNDQDGDNDRGDGTRVHSVAAPGAYRAVRIEITHRSYSGCFQPRNVHQRRTFRQFLRAGDLGTPREFEEANAAAQRQPLGQPTQRLVFLSSPGSTI